MKLNKTQIKSSISLDSDTNLYEIKLAGIKRLFESVYYCFDNVNKSYGKLVDKFEGNKLNNTLVGISLFSNYYIFCFIDLDSLESEYFFVKSFDVINVSLGEENYNIFIYKDFNNKVSFRSDYKGEDFIFKIENEKFVVENGIFGTELYSFEINYSELIVKFVSNLDKNNDKYIDIADFFVMDDLFIKNADESFENFYLFLKEYSREINMLFKINIIKYNDLFYPKLKINLSVGVKDFNINTLKSFRKLLLSFFSENIACYLINNNDIEKYFSSYFNDFTHLEIDELDLDFNIPKNIYVFDENFSDFKVNFLKLRYNLFLLNETYKNKIEINGKASDLNIELSEKRLKLNLNSLELVIKKYEKSFKEILRIIENK